MSHFEYIAIASSLVFSFTALRIVAGLPHVLASARRDAVHLSHVVFVLVGTVLLFWTFWNLRHAEWDLLRFICLLAGPGIVYYLACELVPDEPSSVTSWQDHFRTVRRQYFLGVCAFSLMSAINATLFFQLPAFHGIRFAHLAWFVIGATGAATENPTVHRVIAFGAWIALALAAATVFLPGAFAA